jgi:hypothetical protein
MKNMRSLIVITVATMVLGPSLRATDTRDQLARFWKIAEDRTQAQAESNVQQPPAEQVMPTRLPDRFMRRRETCSIDRVRAVPVPTVQATQSDTEEEYRGNFGVRLFGGLELFNFFWGDTERRREDRIVGNL